MTLRRQNKRRYLDIPSTAHRNNRQELSRTGDIRQPLMTVLIKNNKYAATICTQCTADNAQRGTMRQTN